MRELDDGQGTAGDLCLQTADELLMRFMRHGDIEGRFPEFNEKDEAETEEDTRHTQDIHMGARQDVSDGEAAAGEVKAERHHEEHRFIRHGLHELTLRADLAVGGVDGIRRYDEADTRHGQCEYDEQDIALCEEDGACQKDEKKEAEDVEAFRLIDGDRLLSPQLQEIIEGLQEGRPLSSLHTGGDDAIAPGKQSAKDRR